MGNVFFEKYTQNFVEKLFSDPFLKNQNWELSLDKFYTVYFYGMTCWGLLKYAKTKLETTCFYLIKNIFKKQKEDRN